MNIPKINPKIVITFNDNNEYFIRLKIKFIVLLFKMALEVTIMIF